MPKIKGISADDIVARVGTVRFFSIDGGHALSNVPTRIDFYKQLISSAEVLRKIPKASASIMGYSSLIMRSGHLEYLRCEGFMRVGLGRLNALVY
jgi:hypothetical protein